MAIGGSMYTMIRAMKSIVKLQMDIGAKQDKIIEIGGVKYKLVKL